MLMLALPVLVFASMNAAVPAPRKALAVVVDPVANPDHLEGLPADGLSDLATVLQENGLELAPATDGAAPRLTLQPRVSRLPRGAYAYSVLGYLETPGSKGVLRVFTATALRDPSGLGPGLKQALLDAAADIAARVNGSAPGAPVKRLLVAGAPKEAGPRVSVPRSQVKVRFKPAPPPLPAVARARGIGGAALADVQVDQDGRPARAELVQGPPELSLIMLSYAMDWSFVPPADQGLPAPFHTEIQAAFDPGASLPATGLPSETLGQNLSVPPQGVGE